MGDVKRSLFDWVKIELTLRPELWTIWSNGTWSNGAKRPVEISGIDHVSGLSLVFGNLHHPLIIQVGAVDGLKEATPTFNIAGPTHDYMPLKFYHSKRQRKALLKVINGAQPKGPHNE